MEIAMSYSSKEDIPTGMEVLYTQEAEDKPWMLTGVKDMVVQKDVDDVKEALRKEREDHKKAKEKVREWGELDPKETREKLDKLPELEAIAEGAKDKIDEKKMEEILTARMAQKVGPLERQIETLTEEKTTAQTEVTDLKKQILRRDRNDIVRSAAMEMKVVDTALPDVQLTASIYLERNDEGRFVTKDGLDVTPGLDAKGFLKDMQKIRPHWWPVSEGGGAGGGRGGGPHRGNNPFTRESWNLTEQGRILKESGREEAERLAKAAGTSVGGPMPAPRAA